MVALKYGLSVLLVLSALPALADPAAAEACAKMLSPLPLMIYRDTLPDIAKDIPLPDLIRAHTRQLVIDGKLTREDARPAAQTAGACLKAYRE